MTASNSGTVNISVYVTLDQQDNDNILSFIVQDEYHLKKLAIGAYSLNILDTQLLNNLWRQHCVTISCGDYVICHNFTERRNLNVILFNTRPTILKKGNCIFKIVYSNPPNSKTMQVAHEEPVVVDIDIAENKHLDCDTIDDVSPSAKHNVDTSADGAPVVDDDSISESNRRKFRAAFIADPDDNSDSGSGNVHDTDSDSDTDIDTHDKPEFGNNKLFPPVKKQKLDDAQ